MRSVQKVSGGGEVTCLLKKKKACQINGPIHVVLNISKFSKCHLEIMKWPEIYQIPFTVK